MTVIDVVRSQIETRGRVEQVVTNLMKIRVPVVKVVVKFRRGCLLQRRRHEGARLEDFPLVHVKEREGARVGDTRRKVWARFWPSSHAGENVMVLVVVEVVAVDRVAARVNWLV